MLCVYGIVRSTHPGVDVTGVKGGETRLVGSGDLAAIVSEIDGELLARRRDVEAHLGVLEQALAVGDVIPLRFGAVVPDVAAVRALLDDSRPRFLELLSRIGGLVQMTLKLVRDDDEAVRAVVDADPRLRSVVSRRRGSTVWAEKLELGQHVAAAVERLSKCDLDTVTRQLSGVAVSISVTAAAPPAIAALAILVDPARLVEVDQVVASLHDEFGNRLALEYAGPMPAYSFVG